MWIARNKSGELRLFELPPKRFHDGPSLAPELVGFNDAVTVGDGEDKYSFWAHQEFCESNRIEDRKDYGISIMTEKNENGKRIWSSYIPECAKNMKWEDEPIEVVISFRKQEMPISEDLHIAVSNYTVHTRIGHPRVMNETDMYIYNAFKAGAQWQKERLISKACEWLNENLINYWSQAYTDNCNFIDDFKEAMGKEE